MKKLATISLLLIYFSAFSQSLQRTPVNIINNTVAPQRVFANMNHFGKASTCPVDTVNYTYNKTTQFQAVSLNSSTSGSIFAQWYPAGQPITISGFDFYAWQSANSGAVISITCNIYNATVDSLPSGTPLRTVVVNVDSTFGGGLLTTLRKIAVFPTPVTVTAPYVLTVETSSSINVSVITNSWTANPANGRSQWLSSVKIGTNWVRGYNVNVGGAQFNADFILKPYVQYTLAAGFTPSPTCNQGGNLMTYINTSSPVLFSPFYNTRAFYNIPQFSCLWDYGDTSGSWYAVNGTRTYNYRIPYTVKLKDTLLGWFTGCGDTATQLINASSAAPNATNNGPLCVGATLRLNADTIPGATYYWTGPNGFTSSQQNPIISNASIARIGNYNVRAITGQCSSMVASTYVNIISNPTVSSNTPLCAGQTLVLTSSGISGATYAWTGPNGFNSSQQNPVRTNVGVVDSGTYNLAITLAGCGTINISTGVSIYPVPSLPTVSNNGPLCVGNNLNLSCNSFPNGVYSWTGPNAFSSNQQNPSIPSVQNSAAGTYSVTISSGGCTSAVGSTTVIVNNVPSAPIAGNNGPLCLGQTLSLTATTVPGATYTWNGPNGFTSTSQSPTRSSLSLADAGTYSVFATVNGCASQVSNTSVTITSLTPTPTATSNAPLCPGQTLQLQASAIAGATYNWSGPNGFTSTSQNPNITNVSSVHAGIYSVTAVTSGCGTSSAGTVNVVVNSTPPAPTLGNNGPLCDGQTLNLTASNITGANYNWSGPNGFTSTQQNPSVLSVNATKAGLYSCFVSVPGCGTSPTSSTNVVRHAIPPTPTVLSNSPVCSGDSIKLQSIVFGVGSGVLYQWTGPNNFNSGLANPFVSNANSIHAGTYTLTVTDSGCVSAQGSALISIKSLPTAPTLTNNSPLCVGGTLLLTASGILGATYQWDGPNAFKSQNQNPTKVSVVLADAGTYSLVATVNGCKSPAATTNVVINPAPITPVASNNGPKCVGDNVNLTATLIPGATYSWTGPGGYTSSIQNPVLTNATLATAGTYSVIAISSSCVSNPATTDVQIGNYPSPPVLSSIPASNACGGDSLQLFASFLSGATYDWTGPIGFGSTLQNPVIRNITSANTGQYTATVTKNGCTSAPATPLTITVNDLPQTSAITGLDSVKNYSTHVYSVTNSPGSVYNWIVSGGTIQSGGTSNSITVLWGGPSMGAFIRMRETAPTGCRGPLMQKPIVIFFPVAVSDLKVSSGAVTVYPNPASDWLTLDFKMNSTQHIAVKLLNVLGQEVMAYPSFSVANDQKQLDVSKVQSGVYFLEMIIGEERKLYKLSIE